jgi:hypothetical protein
MSTIFVVVKQDTIVGMLCEKAEKNSELEPEMSCRVVIGCVKNLIDVEQDYLATKASYRLVVFDTATISTLRLTLTYISNISNLPVMLSILFTPPK